MRDGNMFRGIHTTVIGDSHVKKGIVCQDSSGVYVEDEFAVAVVADGHGSEKHFRSDIGSQIAVKMTTELLKKYMTRKDFRSQFSQYPEFILKQMEKQLLMKWREAVEEFHRENPLSEEEQKKADRHFGSKIKIPVIYGSTLLAAVMAQDYSFGLVLGDGGFVVLSEDGKLGIPAEDSNSHANYTSSLCNTNAVRYFEHWYSERPVKAMFVSTDGLFKSFASEEDFLKYHGLISRMLEDPERTRHSLERNFEKRTKEGSGDDISMALVYRT